MNKGCTGIFGKIFGHKFESFMLISPANLSISYGEGESNIGNINDLRMEEFEIRCKRCGCEPIKGWVRNAEKS